MKVFKPHGHKRKHLFKKGNLVRWNRWHLGAIPLQRAGELVYKNQMKSYLGIVLRVYQSPTLCWTATVVFSGIDGLNMPVPVNCLELAE